MVGCGALQGGRRRGILRSAAVRGHCRRALLIAGDADGAETRPEVPVRTTRGNRCSMRARALRGSTRPSGRGLLAADHGHADRWLAAGAGAALDNTGRRQRCALTIGLTVSQTLFNLQDRKYRAPVRGQCAPGRELCARRPGRCSTRHCYTNVLANRPGGSAAHQLDVSARDARHHPQTSRCRRRDLTDVAQAEAAGRGLADLNARRSTWRQPGRSCAGPARRPAGWRSPNVRRLLPRTRGGGAISRKDHPAILAAMYDTGRRPARQDRRKQPVANPVQGSVQRCGERPDAQRQGQRRPRSSVRPTSRSTTAGWRPRRSASQGARDAGPHRAGAILQPDPDRWSSPPAAHEGAKVAPSAAERSARGQRVSGAQKEAQGGQRDARRAQPAAGSDGGACRLIGAQRTGSRPMPCSAPPGGST